MAGGIDHVEVAKEIPFLGALMKKEVDMDYFNSNRMRNVPDSRPAFCLTRSNTVADSIVQQVVYGRVH